MALPVHPEPTPAQLAAIAAHQPDGPIVALNLNRYRARAAYPPGTPDADVSGREAYGRYGLVALQAITHVGGRVLWMADARDLAIGCGHESWEEVVAVWYPSRAAFLSLPEFPGYQEAFDVHRRAAVEHAALLLCDGAPEPVLAGPTGP
jgi:uncharacterized protein (DUF1330 family)